MVRVLRRLHPRPRGGCRRSGRLPAVRDRLWERAGSSDTSAAPAVPPRRCQQVCVWTELPMRTSRSCPHRWHVGDAPL